MKPENTFGTGRIGEIIAYLKESHHINSILELTDNIKLDTLCTILQLSVKDFDELIALNSPVMRTVKGHAFETVFDVIISQFGHESIEIGGDGDIDRKINDYTLQLKTPNGAGTKKNKVQYKTHKTHGAKSEVESSAYYHSLHDFADYLVGLISYNPFKVIFIAKNELPTHPKFPDKIISPFTLIWENHAGVNNFAKIGIKDCVIESSAFMVENAESELLPLCAKTLSLKSGIILNTILNESNFRIWDMSIRGFAREIAFQRFLESLHIKTYKSEEARRERADKADLALKTKNGQFRFLQMKGLSVNNCRFDGKKSTVSVETQLTRGRVNDHPTQSRLYRIDDFDYLIIGIDPPIVQKYHFEQNEEIALKWEFYAIPSERLLTHSKLSNRYKSLQTFTYIDIQKYVISSDWLDIWEKNH